MKLKKKYTQNSSDKLNIYTNKLIQKINDNLNNFNYNVIIANLHEAILF